MRSRDADQSDGRQPHDPGERGGTAGLGELGGTANGRAAAAHLSAAVARADRAPGHDHRAGAEGVNAGSGGDADPSVAFDATTIALLVGGGLLVLGGGYVLTRRRPS